MKSRRRSAGRFSVLLFALLVMPGDGARADAAEAVSGTLELSRLRKADKFEIIRDRFKYGEASEQLDTLPAFAVRIAISGQTALPLQRGPLPGSHPNWEWVFEPGLVQPDSGRAGATRVSLPVALQEAGANCIHNGLLRFTLLADGRVSGAHVEFAAETCAYLQFDLSTVLDLIWTVDAIDLDAQAQIDSQRRRLAARLPRRSLEDLAALHPQIDVSEIGSTEEVSADAMTVFGLVVEGTLYASKCRSRTGDYPFCETMPLPSYSLAKSMVAGLGLMRLERLYPGARHARIADYVPECGQMRWGDVTFEQAVDMATGNFTSPSYNEDEAWENIEEFLHADTHAERIRIACSTHARRAQPGTRWVYHTTDTYILGTALQAFWRRKTGDAEADYYQDLLVPVWRRLRLSPLMDRTRRTHDAAGQPFSGWGLTFHTDDAARIAVFIRDGGRVNGEQLIDPGMLTAALQLDPADPGLPAIGDTTRYQNGFWAYNAGPSLGCRTDVWIPFMSGFGGITLALIPNGHLYFYFSDGHDYAWRRAVVQSHRIKPLCKVRS